MEKNPLFSKTVWGGVLLAVETALLQMPLLPLWVQVAIGALGTFLTVYGFRDAINKK